MTKEEILTALKDRPPIINGFAHYPCAECKKLTDVRNVVWDMNLDSPDPPKSFCKSCTLNYYY